MNKLLREEMEYLITCDDKAITPDVKDDVEMTLDYIDELEDRINKAIEYIKKENTDISMIDKMNILDILRGNDDIELDMLKALNTDLDDDVEMG